MLDSNILNQVREVFSSLTSDITLSVIRNSADAQSKEFTAFIDDIASTSDKEQMCTLNLLRGACYSH